MSPGFLASALLIQEAGLHGEDTLLWILSALTSLAFITAVAFFGRLGVPWLAAAAATAVLAGGVAATITLKMLQS